MYFPKCDNNLIKNNFYYNIAVTSSQVEDIGLFPISTVKDPRVCRLWSKNIKPDLSVAKFKVIYIGILTVFRI